MDETERQRELDRYRVVDSLPDEAYDDIVQLAATVCAVPTALVSLIDRDRQWFKARTGFDAAQTPRDQAFCDHAIRAPELLFEVRDAEHDPRFAANPLVTGGHHVRFYAGMPLVTPAGAAIGTVCVLDRVPRTLDDTQRSALAALARVTMNLIEGRQRERELERTLRLAQADGTAPSTEPQHCTVAIFEVQGAAAAAARLGERAFERLLQGLAESLEHALRPGVGDSISRVSGCAELIAVLHGEETSPAFDTLRERAAAFERQHGLSVIAVASRSHTPDEPLERIFLRADEALTRAKSG